jgi:hypothetical protein
MGSWRPATSGGEFLLNQTTVLHRVAVPEGNALQQQLDLFRAVNAARDFLGFLDQLKCQTSEGRSRRAVARTHGAVVHRRERRRDRIRRAQKLPAFRGKP